MHIKYFSEKMQTGGVSVILYLGHTRAATLRLRGSLTAETAVQKFYDNMTEGGVGKRYQPRLNRILDTDYQIRQVKNPEKMTTVVLKPRQKLREIARKGEVRLMPVAVQQAGYELSDFFFFD